MQTKSKVQGSELLRNSPRGLLPASWCSLSEDTLRRYLALEKDRKIFTAGHLGANIQRRVSELHLLKQ